VAAEIARGSEKLSSADRKRSAPDDERSRSPITLFSPGEPKVLRLSALTLSPDCILPIPEIRYLV
jgi:hypothetical protein